jgi:hypothetical protein
MSSAGTTSAPITLSKGPFGAININLNPGCDLSSLRTQWTQVVGNNPTAAVYVKGYDAYFSQAMKDFLCEQKVKLHSVEPQTTFRTHYRWFGSGSDKVPSAPHVTTGCHFLLYDGIPHNPTFLSLSLPLCVQ